MVKAWESVYGPMPKKGPATEGAPAVAAAGPADPVIPEGTDPVKALQELKASKDAGLVDQATFDLWRGALLKKIRR